MEHDYDHDHGGHENNDEYEEPEEQQPVPQEVEPARPLGRFMSPQIPRISQQPRLSLGVGADAGPRRVRVVAPWKVSEIEVPATVKEEEGNPQPSGPVQPLSVPHSPTKREKVTDEEREVRCRSSRCRRMSLNTSLGHPCAEAFRPNDARQLLQGPDSGRASYTVPVSRAPSLSKFLPKQ